ncbi:MAG: hypothetical protein DI609_09210 [Corynebacterium urealyticum]|uniref:Acyl-CoA carboxylase subunit epsilon n=1 Tax=Corynebacterium urealyticum TaxID=43771 RepID=A0A2W5CVU7_9CORY|nr:MAG: hypothetical protein DI609_09210 [Corynebacterium urealyticum]
MSRKFSRARRSTQPTEITSARLTHRTGAASAEQEAPQAGRQAAVEVVKGNPTPEQRQALEKLVGELTEKAEERRRAKPDTRGWYGSATEPFPNAPEPNPAGFRSPNLPQA